MVDISIPVMYCLYEDVPTSIWLLLKLNHGVKCIVTHKMSYAEFMPRLS